MGNFKDWMLSEIEYKSTVKPSQKMIDFRMRNPEYANNKQRFNSFIKRNSFNIYKFELAKDTFIHFSLIESIKRIIDNKIIEGGSVFAVSCSFGKWVPVVQFNHIIRKRQEKIMSPSDIRDSKRNKSLKDKFLNHGWRQPNFQEEIGAVRFSTNQFPDVAHIEEVIWNENVNLINPQFLNLREAIRLLNNTPYKINENDEIEYF